MPRPALGLIETDGIDGAILATRAASDAGQVVIVSAERGDADRMTVKIEGDWSAVHTAVEAGARAAHEAGQLVSMHVIPRSDDDVSPILPYPRFVDRYRPDDDAPASSKRRSGVTRPGSRPVAALGVRRPVVEPPLEPKVARDMPAAEPVPPLVIKAPKVEPMATPKSEPTPAGTQPTWEELGSMAVVKLRKYARSLSDLPIKGREISKANKQQLLDAISTLRGRT